VTTEHGSVGADQDPRRLTRDHFDYVVPATTRWTDNDMYGHLNNAVYYELFDSAINGWLITGGVADSTSAPEIGVVAESRCRFFAELAYPETIDVAVRVGRVGRSSVTYALGLFGRDGEAVAAYGHWVHVYIDRESRVPVPVPAQVREFLAAAEAVRS
jgi:acyl-CoA thioester hydrolase